MKRKDLGTSEYNSILDEYDGDMGDGRMYTQPQSVRGGSTHHHKNLSNQLLSPQNHNSHIHNSKYNSALSSISSSPRIQGGYMSSNAFSKRGALGDPRFPKAPSLKNIPNSTQNPKFGAQGNASISAFGKYSHEVPPYQITAQHSGGSSSLDLYNGGEQGGSAPFLGRTVTNKSPNTNTSDLLAIHTSNKKYDASSLILPNHEPVKHSNKSNGIIRAYAANTNQGPVRYFHTYINRNYNEDRVAIILNIVKPPKKITNYWPKISFFGLYDGHGGSNCADFLRDNLHHYVLIYI